MQNVIILFMKDRQGEEKVTEGLWREGPAAGLEQRLWTPLDPQAPTRVADDDGNRATNHSAGAGGMPTAPVPMATHPDGRNRDCCEYEFVTVW